MLAFLVLAAAWMAVPGDSTRELDALRWKSRPLLIFAPAEKDARLSAQMRTLEAAGEALRARDVVVLACVGSTRHPKLRRTFGVADDAFVVVLIGKDGGEKWRVAKPFAIEELTRVIDAMPMAREEARARTKAD